MMDGNDRETGARTTRIDNRPTQTDQNAGMPKKPKPYGLTESVDDVEEKTRHSDGQNPSATDGERTSADCSARSGAKG
ncbi:hypothetical protein [Mesorhizobium sp. CAU 1741]|uniref:hypothetical protein n=1 Tax=Mesorhizobium sp. CAU 1741 TaxID=3140366 RepID=UPI00325A58BE